MGPLYRFPTVELGVVPSVVYRMVADEVLLLIVTVRAEVYVPATGENVGIATCCAAVQIAAVTRK